jgi:hypothetical protein
MWIIYAVLIAAVVVYAISVVEELRRERRMRRANKVWGPTADPVEVAELLLPEREHYQPDGQHRASENYGKRA